MLYFREEEDYAQDLSEVQAKLEGPPPQSVDIKKKPSLSKRSYYLLGCLTGVAISSLAYFISTPANRNTNVQDSRAPVFHNILQPDRIGFSDDFAPGMKAYILYKGREIELSAISHSADYANFRVPMRARTNEEEFDVFAVDRDNNRSPIEKVYFKEGYLYKN